jgi:hypothetical protein
MNNKTKIKKKKKKKKWCLTCLNDGNKHILLKMMFLVPFTFLQRTLFYSYLWLNNIPLCIYAKFSLPIRGHLGWFHRLAIVTSAAVIMAVQLSLSYADLHAFSYMPKSSTVGSRGSCISGFWETSLLTYIVGLLVYIHTNSICCFFP